MLQEHIWLREMTLNIIPDCNCIVQYHIALWSCIIRLKSHRRDQYGRRGSADDIICLSVDPLFMQISHPMWNFETLFRNSLAAIIFFVHELGEISKITLFRFNERNKAGKKDFFLNQLILCNAKNKATRPLCVHFHCRPTQYGHAS